MSKQVTDQLIDAEAPPGRILRLKQGYNPNSSSIGTIVFMMPAALLGVTTAFGAAAGLIAAALLPGGRPPRASEPPRQADATRAATSDATPREADHATRARPHDATRAGPHDATRAETDDASRRDPT